MSDASGLLSMDEVEKRYIARVLKAVSGNKTQAAKVLGFDRRTLYRKLKDTQPEMVDDTDWDDLTPAAPPPVMAASASVRTIPAAPAFEAAYLLTPSRAQEILSSIERIHYELSTGIAASRR